MFRLAAGCRLLFAPPNLINQCRGRRRTLTPPPWVPPVFDEAKQESISEENRNLLVHIHELERAAALKRSTKLIQETDVSNVEHPLRNDVRRVGLIATKIGMLPQWTNTGKRILCTLLHVEDNHVVSSVSPEDWFRKSSVGKRKAFNRHGPMWKVTVGAVDAEPWRFHRLYQRQFLKAGIPVKQKLGAFIVTEKAVPKPGTPLDVRHFSVGQYVTATGKTIDWGFQGAMHRWGFRGQPTLRTTKSHRRVGSIGSVGDARVWPGKRLPGHMGYEWRTVSGLQIIRMNYEKQVIYIKGNVPGDIGETILLKDCVQEEKNPKSVPVPTWSPSLASISEDAEAEDSASSQKEAYIPELFRFSSPTIVFTDEHGRKAPGRDKTKAKIAKVKK